MVNELHVEVAAAPPAPTVELLSWLATRTRTYDEAIDTWHSHCPRLTTWEDALIDGLIRIERTRGENSTVGLTDCGRAVLVRAERSRQTQAATARGTLPNARPGGHSPPI